MSSETWNEYRKLVLTQLESLDTKVDELEKILGELRSKLTIIETKAQILAAGSSIVVSIVTALVFKLLKL